MKNLSLKLVMSILLLTPIIVSAQSLPPLPSIITVPPFKKLLVVGNGNTDVVLHQSEEYKLEVMENDAVAITVKSTDTTCIVTSTGLESDHLIRLDIYAPLYQHVDCSLIRLLTTQDTLVSEDISITTYNTDIDILLQTDHLDLIFEGARASLAGTCNDAHILFNGFANGERIVLDATDFSIKNLHVECGILSSLNLNVTDSLWLTGGNNTFVTIHGSPVILQNNLLDYSLTMHNEKNQQ